MPLHKTYWCRTFLSMKYVSHKFLVARLKTGCGSVFCGCSVGWGRPGSSSLQRIVIVRKLYVLEKFKFLWGACVLVSLCASVPDVYLCVCVYLVFVCVRVSCSGVGSVRLCVFVNERVASFDPEHGRESCTRGNSRVECT